MMKSRSESLHFIDETQMNRLKSYERGTLLEKPEEYLKMLNRMIKRNPTFDLYMERADVHAIIFNEIENSLNDLNIAIRMLPKNNNKKAFLPFLRRGTLYSNNFNRDDLALRDFNKGIQLFPCCSLLFCLRGVARENMGNLEGAVDDFSETIRLEKDNVVAIMSRGRIFNLTNRLREAMEDFKRVIDLSKSATGKVSHSHLGRAYSSTGGIFCLNGNKKKALEFFNKAIETDPKDPDFLCMRGSLYLSLNEVEKAFVDFRNGLKLSPGRGNGESAVSCHFYLGLIFQMKEEYKKAFKEYSKAREFAEKFQIEEQHNKECFEIAMYNLKLLKTFFEQKKHEKKKKRKKKRCAFCCKEVAKMKKCGRCKSASYCSIKCQRSHWKHHKLNCNTKT